MPELTGLIDYGAGNFTSVWNAFSHHDTELLAVTRAEQLTECHRLVLPGVGAFSSAIERLATMDLLDPLRTLLREGNIPFLGICVGMQVLASEGTEFSPTAGLSLVAGVVDRFDFSHLVEPPRLPHMGWNDVDPAEDSALFAGIDPEEPSFYFVHSYRLLSSDPSARFSHANYGGQFIAAVEKGNVFGVQFHPEKSQQNGHKLIANFLEIHGA